LPEEERSSKLGDNGSSWSANKESDSGGRGSEPVGLWIHFEQVVDEFETYMLEDDYSEGAFRIGAVRITVDRGRHQALRRLKGQAMTTANVLTDTLDDLSEFLGVDDQEMIERILNKLAQIELPSLYSDVIKSARRARDLYAALLSSVGEREGFERTS